MRGKRLFAGGSVVILLACGAANDPSGTLDGSGGSAGSGTNPTGGAGGTQSNAPTLAEGQRDDTAAGEPAYGGASGGAPQNLSGACANAAQVNHLITATIAGGNSTGSAAEAREALEQPTPAAPVPAHVSMQDFLSHYRPDFPPNDTGAPVVHIQMRQSAVPTDFDLLVALQAPPPPSEPQRVSLTIVVDNTESMGDGLERAKHALKAIAGDLHAGDTVQWLTAQAGAAPTSFTITAPGDPAVVAAIDSLALEAETELAPLIEQGLSAANANYAAGAMNRVLLVSDGASEASTLPSAIAESSQAQTNEIRLTALGTGPARVHGHRYLRTASRFGRGAYRYLDSITAADALAGRFHELFGVAMDSVELSLQVPWYFSVERPFTGAVTDTNTPIEPQYVAPDGSMTFVFRLAACSATAHKDFGGSIDATFDWISPADGTPQTTPHSVLLPDAIFAQYAPDLTKMLAVASYAEALRSLDAKRLTNALSLAQLDPANADLVEIAGLIQKHPVLAAPAP